MSYQLTVSANKIEVDVTTAAYEVSLSRTGSQGSKGDTITDISFNAGNELVFTLEDSSGATTTINAGEVPLSQIENISDVTITSIEDGDVLRYDSDTSTWNNHRLTTTSISDIDNTNKTDGAVLVYSGTTEKYTATTDIDNVNTRIIGGNF